MTWRKNMVQRVITGVVLVGLLAPNIAFAQGAVIVTGDVQRNIERLIDEGKGNAKQITSGVLMTLLANLVSFAANRLAYDAAVAISSAGPGQEPLFDGDSPGEYFESFGKDVAGEAIGLFQESMKAVATQDGAVGVAGQVLAGFNVCAPSANVGVAISLGIKEAFQRPEPTCDFDNIEQSWGSFIARTKSTFSGEEAGRNILNALAQSIDPSSNDFSIAVNIYSQTLNDAINKGAVAAQEQIQTGGFRPVSDFITGKYETPARLVEDNYTNAQAKASNAANENLHMLTNNESAFLQVGLSAAQMFTNTLLSRLTQRVYDGVFKSSPKPDPFAGVNAVLLGGRNAAQNQFRSYLAFQPLEISNYSLVSDFVSCPPQGRGLYNCVMGTSFATALARAQAGAPLTLKEALDEGFIDGSWPLIPASDQARNQDPYCYTYGFCQSNLVKMRKARVIPVGWELAAESPANDDEQRRITLKEVMDNFNNCNAAGELDSEHPWCKLIDPNWVLKYPDTQCRAQVYGQLLELPGSDTRQQECVDMPSCVSEKPDGTCAGYGYCTQEENIWKFRGEACDAQFASCRTLNGPEGEVAYLMSTVDQSNCNESTAGCREYATQKSLQGGQFAFNNSQNIFLNGKTVACDSADGGCRELVRRTSDVQLNLIANASFEQDTNNDGRADAWEITAGATDGTGADAFLGSAALSPNGQTSRAVQTGLTLGQGRFYTLSAYSKGTGTVALQLAGANFTGFSVTGACTAAGDTITLTLNANGEYQRASCTFTAPRLANATQTFATTVTVQGSAPVDAVELEQASAPTVFNEAYSSTAGEKLVAKVPPAYLGCTGGPNDPAECANYAAVCSENDVGCRQFSPENGDPAVTGVATTADVCPAECVGYDAYRQEPTKYEPEGIFPLSFIPSTADSCSEQEVGCSEFTNAQTEERIYASALRQCSTEDGAGTNKATFYTWEGSDETGYQLKTWNLLKSNESLASYTHAASGTLESAPSLAPCTNVTATANGLVCNDDTVDVDQNGLPDWDSEVCDERSDIFRNSDCREFYDGNGNLHYRLWSKTVTVDNACAPYRKTETEGAEVCAATGGYFDGAQGACRYFGLQSESTMCSEQANGCRAYSGGRSRNSRVVFEENFEGGNLQNWDGVSANAAVYSNESLANGGHSLGTDMEVATFFGDLGRECTEDGGCVAPASRFGATCTVAKGERYCGVLANQLSAGKTYTVSVLAKGQGTLSVGFDTAAVAGDPSIDTAIASNLRLTTDWQQFNLGPIDGRAVNGIGDSTALIFQASGGTMYIDNVVLREGEDNIALISGSWSTPASCDTDPTGQPNPGYYLGCRAYTDSEGDRVTLKSFSRLCSSDKVGCDAFYLTQESESPYQQTFTNNNSTVTVPADQDIFLVMTDAKRCDQSAAGCQELGVPQRDAGHTTITGYTSAHLINDPDQYSQTLCGADALFCDAYTADDNTKYYFKSPEGKQCEYRTDVQVNNRAMTGWFVQGTNTPCYGDYVIGGETYGLWRNGDTRYSGWVGACPSSANLCTEFQDPLDVPTGLPYGATSGESYFYVKNEDLSANGRSSETECNGLVSLKEGCALFEDPATPGTSYSASATEMLSQHADQLLGQSKYAAVQPVTCGASPNNNVFNGVNLCTQRCQYNKADGATVLGGSCVTGNDCSDIENSNGEPLSGSCVTVAAGSGLPNDTDTVLKVNRDRQCSEWLACYSSQQVWDEREGRYRSICEAVASCTEFSANTVGNCSAWNFNKPAIPLTQEQYASRDVSWYGVEYSGYSIPNQISAEHLSQVDVAPEKTCQPSKFAAQIAQIGDANIRDQINATEGIPCESDNWCGAEVAGEVSGICAQSKKTDYRLAYDAGSCGIADEGEACPVGICENSGSPCSSADQCGVLGGTCVIGQCLRDLAGTSCTQDSDCSNGQVCNGIVCAVIENDGVAINATQNSRCAAGGRYVPFAQAKNGMCINNRCLVSPAGETAEIKNIEPAVCRAFPEANSPFANTVVQRWAQIVQGVQNAAITEQLPFVAGLERWNIRPYAFKDGFNRVNTCVNGEDCSCNYRKLSFGQGQLTKFTAGVATSAITADDILGVKICTNGGDKQGISCTTASDCNSENGQDGRCERVQKEENALGQFGYCLERDIAMKINGSATEGACLTWLPVDRIAGATDTSAKAISANAPDELNYCAFVAPYVDLKVWKGCAEGIMPNDSCPTDGLRPGETAQFQPNDAFGRCAAGVACPVGYFAVVGAIDSVSCNRLENDDCPFMCVPKGSFNEQGQSCDPQEGGEIFSASVSKEVRAILGQQAFSVSVYNPPSTGVNRSYTVNAYWLDDRFSEAEFMLRSCVTKGVRNVTTRYQSGGTQQAPEFSEKSVYEIFPGTLATQDYSLGNLGGKTYGDTCELGMVGEVGYYDMTQESPNELYLACKETLVGSTLGDPNRNSAPYTDRLWRETQPLRSLDVRAGMYEKYAYTKKDGMRPFGAGLKKSEMLTSADPRPQIIAQCKRVNGANVENSVIAPNLDGTCPEGYVALELASDAVDPDILSQVAIEAPAIPFTRTDIAIKDRYYVNTFDLNTAQGATRGSVVRRLQEIFAMSVDVNVYLDGLFSEDTFSWLPNVTTGGVQSVPIAGGSDQYWDNRAEEGVPPTVWAIDPMACEGTTCAEGPANKITLNGKNQGNQESTNFFTATVKFYAAASPDQLPLRRVVVDWGDGKLLAGDRPSFSGDYTSADNYFKNARGFVQGTDTPICNTNTEWGATPESCTSSYFQASHVYSCNRSDLPSCADASVRKEGGLPVEACYDEGIGACAFRPRVHVRDNWGYCAGVCNKGGDADENPGNTSTSCYAGDNATLLDGRDQFDECDVEYWNDLDRSTARDSSGNDPWIYYDGVVYVK